MLTLVWMLWHPLIAFGHTMSFKDALGTVALLLVMEIAVRSNLWFIHEVTPESSTAANNFYCKLLQTKGSVGTC